MSKDIGFCSITEDLCEKEGKCETCSLKHIYENIEHYAKLHEENRLIELPCKVGEEVWTVHKDWGIQHATYHVANRILFDVENGYVFVKTKEEAQAKWKEFRREKLAELKGTEG